MFARRLSWMIAVVGVTGLMVAAMPASADTLVFDLTTPTVNQSGSIVIDSNLTVSATTPSAAALDVHQDSDGVGVVSGRRDSVEVDGDGTGEILWLAFSGQATLESLTFTLTDDGKDDSIAVLLDSAGGILAVLNVSATPVVDLASVLGEEQRRGDLFGLTTGSEDSGYKLSSATVMMPAPAAIWAGLGLLSAIGVTRRLRRRAR